jgi:hypothetical protein
MMIFICAYFKRRIPYQGGRCDRWNQTADAALQRDGAESDLTPFAASLFFGALPPRILSIAVSACRMVR